MPCDYHDTLTSEIGLPISCSVSMNWWWRKQSSRYVRLCLPKGIKHQEICCHQSGANSYHDSSITVFRVELSPLPLEDFFTDRAKNDAFPDGKSTFFLVQIYSISNCSNLWPRQSVKPCCSSLCTAPLLQNENVSATKSDLLQYFQLPFPPNSLSFPENNQWMSKTEP